MATFQKEIQKEKALNLEMMHDDIRTLSGDALIYKNWMDWAYLENVKNNILFTKVNNIDDILINLRDRMGKVEQEQALMKSSGYMPLYTNSGYYRKPNARRENTIDNESSLQECNQIIERIIEILTEWCETREIKSQIQYAAIIVAKIENIKKNDFIYQNEIRKKICTLLRAVIRLNVTDNVFTKEQILLLKKGFLLLLSDNVQKKDMLQLNKEFWSEHLETMPAWE